ncbi:unnamed protein product [Owenia fusiformis]|uniref:Uncharacterized protein n=1 Tax=Owenia fusiformis TaxID=6347 RepID=A0A8J1U4J7_OWEFU|nr:unnamed protein product [Owenia fusiformis]
MPKRPNPFGDFSPQVKTHVGVKEVDMGVNYDQNMKVVFEKTKNILFSAANKGMTCEQEPIESGDYMGLNDDNNHAASIHKGQMKIDSHGHLYANGVHENQSDMNGIHLTENGHLPFGCQAVQPQPNGQMTFGQPINSQLNDQMTCGQVLNEKSNVVPGQMFFDGHGKLSGPFHGDKNSNALLQQNLMSNSPMCYMCSKSLGPQNNHGRKCNFCDRVMCHECNRQCVNCQGLFCSSCSTINYDECFERTFCLNCLQ